MKWGLGLSYNKCVIVFVEFVYNVYLILVDRCGYLFSFDEGILCSISVCLEVGMDQIHQMPIQAHSQVQNKQKQKCSRK